MNDDVFEYELVNPDNVDLAIKIQNEIFPDENGAINLICSFDIELKKKHYKDGRWREKTYFYICKVNGTPVGITGIYSYYEYPDDAWCGWYGILPGFQGKGYGKKILLWTIEKAKEMGYKNFRLYTDLKENETAVNLYRKIGMIEERYTAEKLSLGDTTIFSISLTADETEKWENKPLFLEEQEKIQAQSDSL